MAVLGSVLQRSNCAAIVHSADLDVLEWNAGAERLFGFTAAEAVGKKLSTLIGSKSNVTRKDGKRLGCVWQEDILEGGAVLAFATNVTELKSRERLLKVMMDNLNVVVWEVEPTGIFTFHDGRKGLDAIGMKPGAMLGINIFEAYGDASTVIHEALAGKPTEALNAAHGRAWQSWTVPLHDAEQRVDGVAGITLDITESHKREAELRAKLELIENQQRQIKDLSIPLIETWEGVLTVPMVGSVDTERASEVMERLLTAITKRRARYAIVDLTGVEEVDTDVAAHIINLARAIQLLGAEGIVTGIRPTMAQAMIQLGADLSGIRTFANLREALAYCLAGLRTQTRIA